MAARCRLPAAARRRRAGRSRPASTPRRRADASSPSSTPRPVVARPARTWSIGCTSRWVAIAEPLEDHPHGVDKERGVVGDHQHDRPIGVPPSRPRSGENTRTTVSPGAGACRPRGAPPPRRRGRRRAGRRGRSRGARGSTPQGNRRAAVTGRRSAARRCIRANAVRDHVVLLVLHHHQPRSCCRRRCRLM